MKQTSNYLQYEKETRERKYKGIQNVVDTFYLYDDIKGIFNRKSIREERKTLKEKEKNKEQNQQQLADENPDQDEEAKNKSNTIIKLTSFLIPSFDEKLKDLVEKKKKIKEKNERKLVEKDNEVFNFKKLIGNKTDNDEKFRQGLNSKAIENKMNLLYKKKHHKETVDLHEKHKILLKVKDYKPISVIDVEIFKSEINKLKQEQKELEDSMLKNSEIMSQNKREMKNPKIFCSKTCGDKLCRYLKKMENVTIEKEEQNGDDNALIGNFLMKRKGINYDEYVPLKKIKIIESDEEDDDKKKERNIDKKEENLIGVSQIELEKRATILQRERQEDLNAVRLILFEFLQGFKFFENMKTDGDTNTNDSSNERIKSKFGPTSKMILTFLDTANFLKSDFEEKDMKKLKSMFKKKKQEKKDLEVAKTKNIIKDAIKSAISKSEYNAKKGENLNSRKNSLNYQSSIRSNNKNIEYNPNIIFLNEKAIKFHAEEEDNKKKK